MYRQVLMFLLIFISISFAQSTGIDFKTPKIILSEIPTDLEFQFRQTSDDSSVFLIIQSESFSFEKELNIINQKFSLEKFTFPESGSYIIKIRNSNFNQSVRVVPGWLSLLPPLLAILLALITRQVLIALFVGIWIGVTIIFEFNPFLGFLYSLTEYISKAPADPDKMSIIVFSLVLGGMVGVISKMGGTQGIVLSLAKYASNRIRGQLVTWLMGVLIFFDDYANTLIVGNTMRPLTDKLKISREKLAYMVDSTAAPVANIAIISTWIGFELSLIGVAFIALGITDNAYITFFKTIPYNFYPIFALITGFTISVTGRDFLSMLKAEKRAAQGKGLLADNAVPLSSFDNQEIVADEDTEKKWYNGIIPIFTVIMTTLLGLWFTGLTNFNQSGLSSADLGLVEYMSKVVGGADSYAVLMWAAFIGSLVAIIMAVAQKLLSLEESITAWIAGIKAMLIAALILTMAWSIGNICIDLKTADYIINITRNFLSPHYIPMIAFIVSALVSFATGTSWGVMAIMMPIVIPMSYLIPHGDATLTVMQQQGIFLSSIASVLAGATFGDHCSPISDTTIMSSMASGSDHIDHVRTQLPYALLGGVISILFGYLPAGFGIHPAISIFVGAVLIVVLIRFWGRKSV